MSDWFGIQILFWLWIGMLLLMIHLIVIPRTCAQRWPAWVPLIGNLRSVLATGSVTRLECLTVAQAHTPLAASKAALSEAVTTYTIPAESLGLALALVALSATPLMLSFGAALIAKWQQAPRSRHSFQPEREKPEPIWTAREKQWKAEAAERIRHLWTIESRRALQAQHRMIQHACLYGFATSAVFAWGLVMNNTTDLACQTRMMTIAAATAAFTSFSLSFGRISVRASIRDTSARMFAYALRAVIISVLAAVLLVALLWHHNASGTIAAGTAAAIKDTAVLSEQPFKGATSFMMLGMLVALIGEGVLSQLTARAAAMVNLSLSQTGSDGHKQLHAVDGLSDHDLVRLGEEGIDSVHALAMASTAYLYFSTPYTLQRICDWQDQALLITYLGISKAQSCREKLMIRGGIDLQRKADYMVTVALPGDGAPHDDSLKTLEIIRSSLGFISIEQARESLFPMAQDETIRRLRIFQRGSVSEEL